MDALIIDGSVTIGFLLADEQDVLSLKALSAVLAGAPTHVPAHWATEVTNALLMAERRKRSTKTDTLEALSLAQGLPVIVDDEIFLRQAGLTLHLARQYGLTIYDAAYLELAARHNATLATVDRDLAKAAKATGVNTLNV